MADAMGFVRFGRGAYTLDGRVHLTSDHATGQVVRRVLGQGMGPEGTLILQADAEADTFWFSHATPTQSSVFTIWRSGRRLARNAPVCPVSPTPPKVL